MFKLKILAIILVVHFVSIVDAQEKPNTPFSSNVSQLSFYIPDSWVIIADEAGSIIVADSYQTNFLQSQRIPLKEGQIQIEIFTLQFVSETYGTTLEDVATEIENQSINNHGNFIRSEIVIADDPAIRLQAVGTNTTYYVFQAQTGEVLIGSIVTNPRELTRIQPTGLTILGTVTTDDLAKIDIPELSQQVTQVTLQFIDRWEMPPSKKFVRRTVNAVDMNDTNTQLAVASGSAVHLMDIATGDIIHTFEHADMAMDVDYSPDEKSLMVAVGWSIGRYQIYRTYHWDLDTHKPLIMPDYILDDEVEKLQYSDDGSIILRVNSLDAPTIYDAQTGQVLYRFEEGEKAAISHNTNIFAGDLTTVLKEEVYIVNGESKEIIHTIHVGDNQLLKDIEFSPDDTVVALAQNGLEGERTEIQFYDVASGSLLYVTDRDVSGVDNIEYSPNGSIIASGSWDRNVSLWDAKSGQLLETISLSAIGSNDLVFSSDGKLLFIAVGDTVEVWRVHVMAQ